MRVSLIQSDIVWEDKTTNFDKLEKHIVPLFNNTDLIILPEMFNTGFSMKPEIVSEPPLSKTYQWMEQIAKKGKLAICGSYAVCEDSRFYNRFVFVSEDGTAINYDKRHLFSMGEENQFFTKGKKRIVFKHREMNITPYICYDLRFPVFSRNRNDCDLMIYSANWPEARRDVWNTLLKARAIENQCYVAGVNRTGADGNGLVYVGESMLINPNGEIISNAGNDAECSITADLSLADLTEFRTKFPAWCDADNFNI